MSEPQLSRRIAKPLGLYILAIFDFVAIGLVQLVSVVVALRSEDEIEFPFLFVLLLVGLPVLSMTGSVWAMAGENWGRRFLLLCVSLSSLLVIINHELLLSKGQSGVRSFASYTWILRALFWLAINWWYLNRQHVRAYFHRRELIAA
jgi:hypothetical protein